MPLVKSGRLRALASSEPQRDPVTPNLPTMVEGGVPNYDVTSWYGLFAPAAVPRPIIERLNREVVAILGSDPVRTQFAFSGMRMTPSTPEEFGARLRADLPKWAKVMRDAGIEPE